MGRARTGELCDHGLHDALHIDVSAYGAGAFLVNPAQRVADGRKMKTEEVEKIAQGRVWLGTDAKSIKLIDGFGSLDDAVAKAAQLAKVSDYGTTEYPMPADWIDQLLDGLSGSGGNYLDEQLRLTLGDLYQPFMMIRNIKEKEPVQAAMPFVLNIH